MSKEVAFPVMSSMISGVLFVLGILLATLGIVVGALAAADPGLALVPYILYFIGLFLFGWGLLSFGLHPDIDENRRTIAFFFAVLLVTVLFGYGLKIAITVA
nr:hypothetical protein [Candidatus Njordarchaeum guaymaensis]